MHHRLLLAAAVGGLALTALLFRAEVRAAEQDGGAPAVPGAPGAPGAPARPPAPSPQPFDPARAAAIRANEEGLRALADGRSDAALAAFARARDHAPEDVTLRRNLAAALAASAEALRAAGDATEAVRLLDQAVDLHGERLRYRVLRGRARFDVGRDADRLFAREDFEYVVARDADHLDARINLGEIAYLDRRLADAVAHWTHALRLRPDDPDVARRLEKAKRELAVEAAYETLPGRHFVVRFGPSVPRDLAEQVRTVCDEVRGDLCARFDHYPEASTVVTLYSPGEFRSATRVHGWVAGLSDGTIRLTVRPSTKLSSLRSTIVHEYTHHLVRDLAPKTPVWLHEGLAQLAAGQSVPAAEARLARAKDLRPEDLDVSVLGESDPLRVSRFYDVSLGFTHFLQQSAGDARITQLLRRLGSGTPLDRALPEIYGAGRAELFARWRRRAGG